LQDLTASPAVGFILGGFVLAALLILAVTTRISAEHRRRKRDAEAKAAHRTRRTEARSEVAQEAEEMQEERAAREAAEVAEVRSRLFR
jgi:Na+-transporting methylmalonyl-CoA/oxaloacetate decarboxylase gamma subunit